MSQILVTQELDPDADERSFRVGAIQLGDIRLEGPDDQAFYQTEVDLRATEGILLRVVAGVDVENRRAVWIITALDPDTGDIMTDPRFGLLHTDRTTQDRQGSVAYEIIPNPASATGCTDRRCRDDHVRHQFADGYAAHFQHARRDALRLVRSRVVQPDANVPVYNVSWSAQDESNGSGVRDFTVYVAEGSGPFGAWLTATRDTTAVYVGESGKTYRFAVQATDNVGNVEFVGELYSAVTTQPATILLPLPPGEGWGEGGTGDLFDGQDQPLFPFDFIDPDYTARTFAWGFEDSGAGIGPRSIAFLPDGDVLITNGAARNALYRLSSEGGWAGTPLALNTSFPLYDIEVDRVGRVWATTGGGPLVQLDPNTGAVLAAVWS